MVNQTKSSYKSALKHHQNSQVLNCLSLETKEGCIEWERCQHDSAKLQKISVYTGNNVTLGAERILFKEALDGIETGFQKNYNTELYIFFECTLYPQT